MGRIYRSHKSINRRYGKESRRVFTPAFVFFHFVNHPPGDSLGLARSQNGSDLSARLEPNDMLLCKYFCNGEIGISASQGKLHSFIRDDPLNLLMLGVCQSQPGDHPWQVGLKVFQSWKRTPARQRLCIAVRAANQQRGSGYKQQNWFWTSFHRILPSFKALAPRGKVDAVLLVRDVKFQNRGLFGDSDFFKSAATL